MSDATARFIIETAERPRECRVHGAGEYRIWRGRSGAEVWLHYPKRREVRPIRSPRRDAAKPAPAPDFDALGGLKGLSIVHAGASAVAMRMGRALQISDNNPLEGLCVATLPSTRDGEKPIPFTFELVEFAGHRHHTDADAIVQVTGLAQKVWGFASELAYLKATPANRLIGSGAVISIDPSDVHDVELIYRPQPGTLWLLTGQVLRATRLINPITSQPYYLIALGTDRGTFDVVANPDVIEGDISVGHTMQTVACVCGRVITPAT
ncbi:MAG: hypothetical protein R3D67_04345 [Hyphomicrobiaceae bacterium]